MPFRRYRRNLRPVVSIKHVVDASATIAAGAQTVNTLMDAVQSPVLTTPFQTSIGARVSSFYLNVQAVSNETDVGAIPNVYMAIFKNPGNNITAPDVASVGTSDSKRFIIHQEMVMLNNVQGGNPRTLFNGVIKVPRGMQRQGNDDTMQFLIKSTALNIAYCIQCIYKEYR